MSSTALKTPSPHSQLVLQDAEIKQRKSLPIQNWLRKLKDVAYDAENILDEMAIESLRRKAERRKVFLSLRNPLLFRFKMTCKVKNVRKKLSDIAEERLKFHLGEGVMENRFGVTLESRQTSSLVNESEIYGRHEEKEMVMEKLLDGAHDQDDLSIFAICGMGGLGKTTLAKLLYNDERIERHFELRIWVCVSDDFDIRRLVKAIIESSGGGGHDITELDPLQRLLRERLGGKRFLLVLDDVWNENHRLWDELKEILRCGMKGNVLVTTTRIEKVASMMATIDVHHIGYLTDDDSWSLFMQRAFSCVEAEESLIAIGKVIVKKCGGVPLAIKALGSLMRFKHGESEWLAVQKSEIWNLSNDQNEILPALRLSYDNLSSQMRQCFAFCCLFPKDYVMVEEELIKLWMANGFVSSDGQGDMFVIGHLIFKELTWRSFFQDIKIDYRGERTCKMHDLMHDLAISIMGHETYVLEHGQEQQIPKTVRHLCFDSSLYEKVSNLDSELQIDGSLRSMIGIYQNYQNYPCSGKALPSFLSKQQNLRALRMRWPVENYSNILSKLKHLKHLCISCWGIKRLPQSITHLYNLQTLKLLDSSGLLELPKNLKSMNNLWSLELEDFRSLVCTPPGLGELTCLRRLSIFIVGQDASQHIDQLKELNLGGELSIKGLNNVLNLEEAKSANLMAKCDLTCLKLYWTIDLENSVREHFEEVLHGLEPSHENLRRLFVVGYQGSKFPNWMLTLAFEKLEEIRLMSCSRCECLPTMGKLPRLGSVFLGSMKFLKCLDAEWYGDAECLFPALNQLEICDMPDLEGWSIPCGVRSFPRLTQLCISRCPKLDRLPFLPSLTNLWISDCNAALTSCITCLTALKSLTIRDSTEDDVLPGASAQPLMTLEYLRLGGRNVTTLSDMLISSLSSLKNLYFDDCPNLESVPEGLKCLNSLERLDISGCDALTSFCATTLDGLSSLRYLDLQTCKKLKPLLGPLNREIPLQHLRLFELPELEYFPESIIPQLNFPV